MSTTAPATSTSSQLSAAYEPPSLTTTFIPPPECTANHLTMMADMQFSIFLNEPLPVPNTTMTSCYPSQFGNSWLLSAAGTTLPAFSPLVCPQDYTTALNGTGGYIACCPSGYLLNAPQTLVSSRPAFGAQCYTPITVVTATSYDNFSLGGEVIFSSSSGAQAFAYPIDGFALTTPDSSSSSVIATTTAQNFTAASSTLTQIPALTTTSANSTASSSSSSSSSSTHISSGAIAGIVIGSIAILVLLCSALLLFIRNHRLKATLSRYRNGVPQELDSARPPVELHGDTTPIEADGSNFLVQDGQSFYRGGPNWTGEKSW